MIFYFKKPTIPFYGISYSGVYLIFLKDSNFQRRKTWLMFDFKLE